MGASPLPAERRSRYHGLLGTVVEVRVTAADEASAVAADARALAEIQRLERVFNVHDPGSALSRWARGEPGNGGPELAEVLALALEWHRRSGGAFNPQTGQVSRRWRAAAEAGVEPAGAELDRLAARIAAPPYRLGPDGAERTGDCSGIDLNALAKGWIVDRALDAACSGPEVDAVLVNAGGDLAHRGSGSILVGVENPLRPYDNEPPLTVIALAGAAVATTGGARRSFQVGPNRHSHVLDPRTARPVAHTASATVLAPDAATADVAATVASVLAPDKALAFIDTLPGAACLLIFPDGSTLSSPHWPPPPEIASQRQAPAGSNSQGPAGGVP